jgi:uncharacterized protein (TIGR02246 family)
MGEDTRKAIVDALSDAFVDAWNRHDPSAMAGTLAPDADLVNFRGRRVSGREEIGKFLARAFGANLSKSVVTLSEHTVRFVADAAASVDLVGTIAGLSDPKGAPRPQRSFRCDSVAVRNPQGGWWFVVLHLKEGPVDAGPQTAPGPGPSGETRET